MPCCDHEELVKKLTTSLHLREETIGSIKASLKTKEEHIKSLESNVSHLHKAHDDKKAALVKAEAVIRDKDAIIKSLTQQLAVAEAGANHSAPIATVPHSTSDSDSAALADVREALGQQQRFVADLQAQLQESSQKVISLTASLKAAEAKLHLSEHGVSVWGKIAGIMRWLIGSSN